MSAASVKTVTVEEYLDTPEYEHCEYIDGEVVELNVGSSPHSRISARTGQLLLNYFDVHPPGVVLTEPHCRLTIGGRLRYRLPDIAVALGKVDEPYFQGAPDLCIEIRSPKDSIAAQISKFEDYFANGCKLGWLILPEEESVLILSPGASPRVARKGGAIDGGTLLPALRIEVDALLA